VSVPPAFHGIYPILYAYFDEGGAPLREPIAAQVEAAVRHGSHGIAILGLATETNKLDTRERRKLHLHVASAELARRKAKWKKPAPHADRGWVKLYCETVNQADEGVDLDFLVGKSGAKVGRPSH